MRLGLLLVIVVALSGCEFLSPSPTVITLRGTTMGTSYQIKIIDTDSKLSPELLKMRVEKTLTDVNNNLSNWIKTSEISKFNNSKSLEPVSVSPDMSAVLSAGLDIHRKTDGRFDVTLAPLIRLWGFGPNKDKNTAPSQEAIDAAKANIGMSTMLVLDSLPGEIAKKAPDVTINLSAIAKGYGVDRISQEIEKLGAQHYLVEIGGDLYSKGLNASQKPWVIGIEKPEATGRSVHKAIKVSNLGVATSGDYRNYVERDGKRFSHIIDPVTGRPITHNLASVTILSDNAMKADGWATALFVLGEEAGLKAAEKHQIAAYFIVRKDGGFVEKSSSKFKELVK